MPSTRGSSWPRNTIHIYCNSCLAGRFFTTEPPGKPRNVYLRYFIYLIPPSKYLILIAHNYYLHFISETSLSFFHTQNSWNFFIFIKDCRQYQEKGLVTQWNALLIFFPWKTSVTLTLVKVYCIYLKWSDYNITENGSVKFH